MDYWQLSLMCLVLLILWGLGVRLNRRWTITASVVGISLLAAAGSWVGMWYGWLVFCMIFLLASWDLQWFSWRLIDAKKIRGEKQLVQLHLQRLLIILGIGLLLAMIALFVQVKFSFGIALLLGLSVVLGLSQWISIARRSTG